MIFALPFVPGHQPLHITDILGLVFVMTGLIVYRFGPSLNSLVGRVEATGGGDRFAKVASRFRTSGSTPSYAAGDHREPLLDLAEDGDDDEDRGFYAGRRVGVAEGRDARGKGGMAKRQPVDDEWEM